MYYRSEMVVLVLVLPVKTKNSMFRRREMLKYSCLIVFLLLQSSGISILKTTHFMRPFDRHMYCFSCRNKPRSREAQTDACQKWADGTPGATPNRCKVCQFATPDQRKLWKLPASGTRPYKGQ